MKKKRIFVVVSIIFILLLLLLLFLAYHNNSITVFNASNDTYENIIDQFASGEITYGSGTQSIQDLSSKRNNSILTFNEAIEKIDQLKTSKQQYEIGVSNMGSDDFKAISALSKVSEQDTENYSLAQNNIILITEQYIEQADTLVKQYFYEEAISLLESIKEFSNKDKIDNKINEYKLEVQSLELYEDRITHIFFHSLIAVNELAFDGDYMEEGYNYWMTTTSEFKAILNELYEKNYLLIDIHMLYDTKIENGEKRVFKKDLYLPKGKKPLVISLDDQNYYEYMQTDGFADCLVLDDDGNVATKTYIPEKGYVVERDNDCIPILDVFVENHPDFSYKNAKGIVGLTGYEGILGYRTDKLDAPDYEEKVKEVTKIVERLKETGWIFASHSYGHIDVAKSSMNLVKEDTEQWEREVGSIVGPTDVYIYPYGSFVTDNSQKLEYLIDSNFNIFCDVCVYRNLIFYDNSIMMNRINLDGYRMMVTPEKIDYLINSEQVLDKDRPLIIDTLG